MSEVKKVTKFKIGDVVVGHSGNIWRKTGPNQWLCLVGKVHWKTGEVVHQGDHFISHPKQCQVINIENYIKLLTNLK
jgi:hypothetical protein